MAPRHPSKIAGLQPLIRLVQASFGYAGRPILAGVDLEVGERDFVGIVGPNGSGKTTLVRGLLGLVPPLSGTVERRGVVFGYVPQRESLDANFPLSALEVVEMGAYRRLSGLRRLTWQDRVAAAALLERVGLSGRSRHPFSELSGGQRQRVLLARALLARPNVLLLDEPTSGVDRDAQAQILELLRELQLEGLAILLVSHQLAMVRAVAGRTLLVTEGRVELASAAALEA